MRLAIQLATVVRDQKGGKADADKAKLFRQ